MFECPNGVMNANVYFADLGEAGLIFRYYDKNNYYSLSINKDNSNKLILSKVVNSDYKEINDFDIPLKRNEWYRFKIVFHIDLIEVWL